MEDKFSCLDDYDQCLDIVGDDQQRIVLLNTLVKLKGKEAENVIRQSHQKSLEKALFLTFLIALFDIGYHAFRNKGPDWFDFLAILLLPFVIFVISVKSEHKKLKQDLQKRPEFMFY